VQIVNFQGLAQASAISLAWPLVDDDNNQFGSIDAAKLSIDTKPVTELTLGSGLSYTGGEIVADLTNDISDDLFGNLTYELWIKVGPDKLAAVRGVMSFTATKARL